MREWWENNYGGKTSQQVSFLDQCTSIFITLETYGFDRQELTNDKQRDNIDRQELTNGSDRREMRLENIN